MRMAARKGHMRHQQGYVFYDGPSELDGNLILGIAVGFVEPSSNEKTGPMIQGYLLRKDTPPVLAALNGADFSVCGDCPLRTQVVNGKQERPCYELVFQGPRSIWDACQRGKYDTVSVPEMADLLAGWEFRVGAYGDPAALKTAVWQELVASTRNFSSYTHQWRTCDQELQKLAMASVETLADRELAKAKGWRTFRVRTNGEPVTGEVTCPASVEAGHKTQCIRCHLCNGVRREPDLRKDITALAHGRGAWLFKKF